MIGALGELKFDFFVNFDAIKIGDPHRIHIVLADVHNVAAKIVAIQFVSADAPDAGENLARHQKRHELRKTSAKRAR